MSREIGCVERPRLCLDQGFSEGKGKRNEKGSGFNGLEPLDRLTFSFPFPFPSPILDPNMA